MPETDADGTNTGSDTKTDEDKTDPDSYIDPDAIAVEITTKKPKKHWWQTNTFNKLLAKGLELTGNVYHTFIGDEIEKNATAKARAEYKAELNRLKAEYASDDGRSFSTLIWVGAFVFVLVGAICCCCCFCGILVAAALVYRYVSLQENAAQKIQPIQRDIERGRNERSAITSAVSDIRDRRRRSPPSRRARSDISRRDRRGSRRPARRR